MSELAVVGSPGMGGPMQGYQAGLKFNTDQANTAADTNLRTQQANELVQRMQYAQEDRPQALEKAKLASEKARLENALTKTTHYEGVLNRAASELEVVPPAARHSHFISMLKGSGLDHENDPEVGHMVQNMSKVPGEQLPQMLGTIRENLIKNDQKYRQAIDAENLREKAAMERQVSANASHERATAATAGAHLTGIRESNISHEKIAQMNNDARQALKVAGNKATDIYSQVQSGKLTAEKAAVAFSTMAMQEKDVDAREEYMRQARMYEQMAMQLRAAGNVGKPDITGITGLPSQTMQPALPATLPLPGTNAPPSSAGPMPSGGAQVAPGGHSLADVQKMYPGASAAQLQEAYKKKFGVDLR